MNTHDAFVRFGKYEGERLTRVPVGYLKWAVSNSCTGLVELKDESFVPMSDAAKAEISRRGERLEDIDVSHHAIDRASLYLIARFRLEHGPMEGIASWLARKAKAAWEKRESLGWKEGDTWKVKDDGIVFVIDELAIPVVKTVEPA